MNYLLVGDIHHKIDVLIDLCQKATSDQVVIQLGDLGFKKDYEKLFSTVSAEKLKVVAGNHDEYSELEKYPHCLGDWGRLGTKIVYCRGAYSPNKHQLIEGQNWWPNEELTKNQLDEFLAFYEFIRPVTMLSHTCPAMFASDFNHPPGLTERYFDKALEIHQPSHWIHAHMHTGVTYTYKGCQFRSLNVNESVCLKSYVYLAKS